MNAEKFKGQWNQLKGNIKKYWGDLTDDDVTKIEGEYDKLVASLQHIYGHTKEKAKEEIETFMKKHGGRDDSSK